MVEAFNEAKGFLSLDKEDIGQRCWSHHFLKSRTWDDLKDFLRTSYGTAGAGVAVRNLRSLFKVCKGHDSLVAFSARCFDAAKDFLKNMGNSGWVNRGCFTTENLEKLLQYAWILNDVPDAIVNSFDKEIERWSDESLLFSQIRKHMSKYLFGRDAETFQGYSKASYTE